jgi:hypothetical protein
VDKIASIMLTGYSLEANLVVDKENEEALRFIFWHPSSQWG